MQVLEGVTCVCTPTLSCSLHVKSFPCLCVSVCVCVGAKVTNLGPRGEVWNKAAVTDRFFSAHFPHWRRSLSSFLFNSPPPHTHTQARAENLQSLFFFFFFFHPAVAHSCCTVLIAFKGKTACISKRGDESGLMIYNTWALFIGTAQKVEASGEKQQKKSRRDSFCVTHLYF